MSRIVIFNADDFGAADCLNRGIVAGHVEGVVTSTSLMVAGEAAQEAARLAASHPGLAVGLHWDLDGVRTPVVDFEDSHAVRDELERQLLVAERMLPRPLTHLDSHHHLHSRPQIAPIARELARRSGLPLRGASEVHYIGGFYAQWEDGVDELEHVSVEALESILRGELADGWTEIGCHPGYLDDAFQSGYRIGREAELKTLMDPRVRRLIDELGLRLASFAELAAGS
ncbi:MAG TPA: ChbG/HpnK family deacetylase [Solirubrobacteraceae bacterium]|nr:ChbG/HpnK family deacetylase [Solirubrobacteraceae bacterium]